MFRGLFCVYIFLILSQSEPNFAVKNYKMEKIVVNPKDKKLLIEKYGYKNVSVALSFKSNSVMAKEIRHEAMNVYKGTIFKF